MRITFIQDSCENLAIEYLSSLLKKEGHHVSLVIDPQLFNTAYLKNKVLGKIFDAREIAVQEVGKTKPDLVAFSVFTSDYQWALGMARRIKKRFPDVPIIFGGIHPTTVPEVVIKEKNVDIVCVGEGEGAIIELARSFDKKRKNYRIKNLWFKKSGRIIKNEIRPLLKDLDKLPLPDKDIFLKKSPSFLRQYYLIMATRGCPYHCTFCANHVRAKIYRGKGKYLRIRSVENVIKELVWARKKYPELKMVGIPDDILPLNKVWLREFIARYKKEVHLPFLCYTHPRYIDKEIAELLKEGGCFWLNMGLQTASETNRIQLLKRVESNEEIRRAVNCCHKVKLRFSLDHIFGIPFEGEKEYIDGLKFYNELRPDLINNFWLVYFPKTEIIELGKKAGYIDEKTEQEINEGKVSTCCTLKIGEGSKDISRSKEGKFQNFALLYTLLPIIPKRIMSKIFDKKWYKKIPEVSGLTFFLVKFICRIPIGQTYLYTTEIEKTSWWALKILKAKWQIRKN